jgi:hypothetical protein
LTRKGGDHRVADTGHGGSHHPQELILGFLAEHVGDCARVGCERPESFRENSGAGLGIGETGGPDEPPHLVDGQAGSLPDLLHGQEWSAANRERGGQPGQRVAVHDEIVSGRTQVDEVTQQLQPQRGVLVNWGRTTRATRARQHPPTTSTHETSTTCPR